MYEYRVVRERRVGYGPTPRVHSAEALFKAFQARMESRTQEEFLVVILDGRNKVMGFHVVSVGLLTTCLTHPREVFAVAVQERAAAIIVIHNHPSGEPEPSSEDMALSDRLKRAGDLLGIKLLDHIVIGHESYRSIAEQEGW